MQANTVQVGETLHTYQQFVLLPVGTQIGENPSDPWTKQEDGRWRSRHYQDRRAEQLFSLGQARVFAYPEGHAPEAVKADTLQRYKYHFRDWSLAAQEQHGVSAPPVVEALRELGCTVDQFPPGPGLVMENHRDREGLPTGTIAHVGEPEDYHHYGLFVKQPANWDHLIGNVTSPYDVRRPLVVESVPGVEESLWITAEATEVDAEAIAIFKRQAWVVAKKVKDSQQWCGTFEHCMARMGLSRDVLRVRAVGGFSLGDRVTCAQCATLPVGTVLRWRESETSGNQVYYVRVQAQSNRAGTRRIFAYRLEDGIAVASTTASHYASVGMEIVHIPGEHPMALSLDWSCVWDFLPPGTVLDCQGERYVMCRDHSVTTFANGVRDTGSWMLSAFSLDQWDAMQVVDFGGHR